MTMMKNSIARRWIVGGLLSAAALVACAGAAIAAPLPSAVGDRVVRADEGVRSAHAWVAIPAQDGREATIFHIPPRDGLGRSGVGTLRRVIDLSAAPEAMCAVGERVFLIQRSETIFSRPQGRKKQRQVLSIKAVPMQRGLWDFQPAGSARTEPPVPGDGDLVDAAGYPGGAAVLLAPVAGEASGWRVLILIRGAWSDVSWPAELDAKSVRWARLVGGPELMLIVQRADAADAELWKLDSKGTTPPVPSKLSDAGLPGKGVMQALPQVVPGDDDVPLVAPPAAVAYSLVATGRRLAIPRETPLQSLQLGAEGSQIYAIDVQGEIARLRCLTAPDAMIVAEHKGVPAEHAAMFIPGLSRSLIVWPGVASTKLPPAATRGDRPRILPKRELFVVEASTSTGQVLFEGKADSEGPLTQSDLQRLAIAIGMLTAAVLLFVLRADNTDVVPIPPRTSLAPPMRRFVAAVIDFVPAYLVMSAILDVSVGRLFLLGNSAGFSAGISLLLGSLAIAALHCTLSEWLTGRSLGKLITGCAVTVGSPRSVKPVGKAGGTTEAQAEADEETPRQESQAPSLSPFEGHGELPPITLWQALVRNLMRWTPPFAALLAFDVNFRHPGDVIAKTVVVVPDEEEEDIVDDDL